MTTTLLERVLYSWDKDDRAYYAAAQEAIRRGTPTALLASESELDQAVLDELVEQLREFEACTARMN